MRGSLKQLGLVLTGAVLGFALTLNFSAVADKSTTTAGTPLPIEDLRTFSEIFGRIKTDYVEPVDDHKLIKEAITGMVAGLDPHSAYLDQEAYKELQDGTQGEFGGLGIEVTMEDGLVKVVTPIDDTPASKAGITRRKGEFGKGYEVTQIGKWLVRELGLELGPNSAVLAALKILCFESLQQYQ